jgi:hypothetical protein
MHTKFQMELKHSQEIFTEMQRLFRRDSSSTARGSSDRYQAVYKLPMDNGTLAVSKNLQSVVLDLDPLGQN